MLTCVLAQHAGVKYCKLSSVDLGALGLAYVTVHFCAARCNSAQCAQMRRPRLTDVTEHVFAGFGSPGGFGCF